MEEDKQKSKSVLGGVIAVMIGAVATGAVGYLFGVMNDFRKSELDFTNAQIEKLYGPLYALTQTGKAAWDRFHQIHWKESRPFDDANPPPVHRVVMWRLWMKAVFQPINLQMEKTIVTNSQLVIGNTMPKVFVEFLAHTEAYNAVLAQWKDTDFDACGAITQPNIKACEQLAAIHNTAGVNYPATMDRCVSEDYNKLKQRQQELRRSVFASLSTTTVERSEACN